MENIIINMKLTRLTYPIEYGSIFAPHPDNIYDIEPPMEENGINMVDVPIASTIVNPNNMVNIGIIKTPPPIPKSPAKNPTTIPIIPAVR